MVGLRTPFAPAGLGQPQGLQYKPLSPGRGVLAGGLQGLGQYLLALGSGQPQNALPAFQSGLAGFDEGQYRRQQQAQDQEEREYRRARQQAEDAERAEKKAKAAEAEKVWGGFASRLTDDDPTNDPTGIQDLLPYLPPEMQMQMAPDLFKGAEPPKSRERREGSQTVFEEFDPKTGTWNQVSSGPAWAPQQPAAPASTNLITLVSPDGKAQRSVDSRDPNLKGLIEQGWIERQTSMFPAAPSGYRYTQTGNLEAIPQGPADPANPNNITGDQRKVASFAERLESANKIIDENEGAGTSYVQEGLSSVPLVGTMLASEPKQKLTQAQRDFINAQLRRESGATIQATEFDSAAKQYFPQPGEGPEIVAQKKEARRIAIENMKREAGAALPKGGANPDDPLGILD